MADAFGPRGVGGRPGWGRAALPPFEVLVERFAALCDRAAEHDLLVALEFMPWTGIPNVATAAALGASVRAAERRPERGRVALLPQRSRCRRPRRSRRSSAHDPTRRRRRRRSGGAVRGHDAAPPVSGRGRPRPCGVDPDARRRGYVRADLRGAHGSRAPSAVGGRRRGTRGTTRPAWSSTQRVRGERCRVGCAASTLSAWSSTQRGSNPGTFQWVNRDCPSGERGIPQRRRGGPRSVRDSRVRRGSPRTSAKARAPRRRRPWPTPGTYRRTYSPSGSNRCACTVGIEDAVWVVVGPGPRGPLPVEVVVGDLAVGQPVEEVLGAAPPVDVQILREERGHDHASAIVHEALGPQLPHRRVDHGIPGATVGPGAKRARRPGSSRRRGCGSRTRRPRVGPRAPARRSLASTTDGCTERTRDGRAASVRSRPS